MENIKYFLYARKSSEPDDRQVLSIESQINELKDLAKKRNLEILDCLTESKSAKAPGRPVFNKMMSKIQDGEANGIICWKLDRLARNPVDGGQVSWLLQQGVIQSIQTFEKEHLPTDNVLLMSVELGMANQYIRDLSLNTKRGIRDRANRGFKPGVVPIGYLNYWSSEWGKTIIKDSLRYDLVRKMWDMMLSGLYSPAKICEIATDDWKLTTVQRKRKGGGPLHPSMIYKILTQPFYYGYFRMNGELYKGCHEPMVTEEEYWQVQGLLGKKGQPRPRIRNFSYTGMIKCGECGKMITAEERHKVNKTDGKWHYYVYYHCSKKRHDYKCQQPHIEIKELERQVDEYLERITISERFKNWALKYIRELNDQETEDRTNVYKTQQKAYTDVQNKLDNLLDLRLRELLTDEEFKEKKNALLEEKGKLKEKLGDTDYRADRWFELAENTFNFCQQARYWFNNGTLEDKKIILKTIGSNLILKDKILQIEPDERFKIIENGLKINSLVAHTGVEPVFSD